MPGDDDRVELIIPAETIHMIETLVKFVSESSRDARAVCTPHTRTNTKLLAQ